MLQEIKKIHHIAITTENPEKLAAFYAQLFGFEYVTQPGKGSDSVWLQLPDTTLLMFEKTNNEENPVNKKEAFLSKTPGFHLIAFEISRERRTIWLERIQSMRIPIEKESEYSIYFLDPDRNRVCLSHYRKTTVKSD